MAEIDFISKRSQNIFWLVFFWQVLHEHFTVRGFNPQSISFGFSDLGRTSAKITNKPVFLFLKEYHEYS